MKPSLFRGPAAALALVLLAALLVPCHALHGIDAGPGQMFASLFAPAADDSVQMLLHHLRLPRTLAAILTGACLATAGTLFQAVTRNPLASPGILGVTAGAQLFVAAVAIVPIVAAFVPPALAALAGGLAAGALTWIMSGGSRAGPVRVALSGMAVSLMAGAGASALALLDENAGAGFYLWGGGSLVQSGWSNDLTAAAGLAAAFAAALILSRSLDIMALGDDAVRALGSHLNAVRSGALLLGVGVSALAVTLAGPVVFVGLLAPNLVRLLGFSRHAMILPLAAAAGAGLMLGADLIVLRLSGTVLELPVGVPIAVIGAPALILLARRLAHDAAGPEREFSSPARRSLAARSRLAKAWLIPVLIAVLATGVMVGNRWIGPEEIAALFRAPDAALAHILELRGLRVAGSGLAGALLALSGLLLQGVVRNPLASPDLLGVTQGAGLLAVIAIVAFPGGGGAEIQAAALTGGLLTVLFVAALGLRRHLAPSALALMALGFSAFSASLTSGIVIGSGFQASAVATWLAGSTYGADAGDIALLAVGLAFCVPAAALLLGQADILAFGRAKAASLGLSVRRSEVTLLALGALSASLVAAMFGPVSFVGLMAPHAARLLWPAPHRQLMLPTLAIGAIVMIAADLLGRILLAPIEIPVGIMTALLGAPFVLLILRRA